MVRSPADADHRRQPGGSRGCYPGWAQPGHPGFSAAGLPGQGAAAPRAGGAGRCCPEAREGPGKAAGSPPPQGVRPGVAERFGERPRSPRPPPVSSPSAGEPAARAAAGPLPWPGGSCTVQRERALARLRRPKPGQESALAGVHRDREIRVCSSWTGWLGARLPWPGSSGWTGTSNDGMSTSVSWPTWHLRFRRSRRPDSMSCWPSRWRSAGAGRRLDVRWRQRRSRPGRRSSRCRGNRRYLRSGLGGLASTSAPVPGDHVDDSGDDEVLGQAREDLAFLVPCGSRLRGR
jgi:hypothetical protein